MYAYSEKYGVISSQFIVNGLFIRESLYAENTFVYDCFFIFCFIVIFIIHAKIGQKTGRTRLCALK